MSDPTGPPPPPADAFRTTRWSLVRAAGARGERGAAEALEQLCALYWGPVHGYLRRRARDEEEARDLTQGLFARLLARDDLGALDAARGRFRAWLVAAARNFLLEQRGRERAEKRGGGARPVSLDAADADGARAPEPADPRTPEAEFDRAFALALLGEVLARLRAERAERGREQEFERLKGFLVGDPEAGGYRAAAEALATTEGALKVAVHRLRRRYRELLLEEVGRTVDDPSERDDELRALFAALAR